MLNSVREWLAELGLEVYADAFEANHIDLDLLSDLSDGDLKELGVLSLGHRRRLLSAISRSQGSFSDGDASTAAASSRPGSKATLEKKPRGGFDPETDRRQLTVMFADLAGSTALSTQLDPEDYRAVIRDFQDACSRTIVRSGGFVARYMGDGVLAYFGWPQSREDDAERAVAAGLEVVEAVAHLTRPGGALGELAVRVGISTGPVIVGDIIGEGASQEAAVTGVTPNLAARLQQIAPPNAVVISSATRDLLRELFLYETLGPQSLKGIGTGIDAWRVTGRGLAGSRFEAAHEGPLTPLVGRDHELSLLIERWDLARGGEGGVTVISGEAGIGKSRLGQAMIEHARLSPHILLRFQCSPYDDNSPYSPVIRQIERASGFILNDTSNAKIQKLDSLLRRIGATETDGLALIANLLMLSTGTNQLSSRLSPQQIKQQTLDTLCELVFRLTVQKPVLLLCEDAHWIDPSSLELLDLVVSRVESGRLLLLVTQRPEWTATFLNRPQVHLMPLGRLSRKQVAEIVRYVGEASLDDSAIEQIADRSDGIPLFVEEITRSVVTSDSGSETDDVPATLQASLTARLDRLSASARTVAQVASVIGREVTLPLLTNVVQGGVQTVDQSLDELFRSQLVLRSGTASEPQITFRHALIRDAAYQSLLKSRRQGIHRQVAKVIADMFPQVADARPELVAQHLAAAGDALGSIEHWSRAGKRATEALASKEAVGHYNNALVQLSLTPRGSERDSNELRLRLALGVPLIASTGYASDAVRQNYERSVELSDLTGNVEALFTATRGLWNCVFDRAELDDALTLANRLVALAGPNNVKGALAQRALGSTLVSRGEFEGAVAAFDRCVANGEISNAIRVGDDVELPHIIARQYKGFVRCLQGRKTEGLALLEAAVALAREGRHALALTFALHLRGVSHFLVGEYEACRRSATEAQSLAGEHGLIFWIAGSKIIHGSASAHLSGSRASLAVALEGIREWRGTAASLYVPTWSCFVADAALSVGDIETAESLLRDAQQVMELTRDAVSLADLERLKGEVAIRHQDASKGAVHLETAIATAKAQGAHLFELRAAITLSRLLRESNQIDRAHQVLIAAVAGFEAGEDLADLVTAKAFLRSL